ncbi:MAG: 3-hydroxyacyl-CoA dehydrogenase family protein [Bacteroidetes bacterium]|nr:3-hydroxyacyl-CoA dehydrogenase family protein [Bacteroidota bacterium]
MENTERLQNVSVLGAAGKMGSGILLLTALELADLSLKPENKDKTFILNAIDVSDAGLSGLMKYLQGQFIKAAEKKTVQLRGMYENRDELIENYDIINQYVFDVMNIIRPTTKMEVAYNSTLVFEAIIENPDVKVKLLSQIDQNNHHKPWYFTNTSSIPITQLDSAANLGGRILGVHFYNPPAVQKLVEVIKGKETREDLNEFALGLIKSMRKKAVPSNDFAGFIGNGHFMRDALHGINEAKKLAKESSWVEGVYTINKVTQDYLVRPMGIFQLIDYVGVEVCSYIMSVMNPHVKDEDLHSDVLDQLIVQGVLGGQYSSGAQKDGILKYEKGRPVAVWDLDRKDYIYFTDFQDACDAKLGKMPSTFMPWKAVNFNRSKAAILETYFNDLNGMNSLGANIAKTYNSRSNEIGKKLVADSVAHSEADVNTVMLTGFFHAYGPINEYLK